jgi:hypothetical protein
MGRPKKEKQEIEYRTFEECYPLILSAIKKRKYRWQLTAIPAVSFEDVMQIILRHVYLKWHLYKQDRPLSSWLAVVINNQMINLIRNYYGNFAKPCLKCEFYEGNESCGKFGVVSSQCDLYRTWVYGKKTKHDIQLSLPMENHSQEVFDIKSNHIDIDRSAKNIHEKMRTVLKPLEWQVYEMLFIKMMSEEEVGKILKFKSGESGRSPGYNRVNQIKKIILNKVKELLQNGDIEIV